VNAKESCSEASVIGLAAHATAASVSRGVGVEEFASPLHGLLSWLDNWFSTSPEERMRNSCLAYWS
jgi:hypothetical protein